MEKELNEKITEKIRKLIRLQQSASAIGYEGEAHAAACAINRLLTEYNLSLVDITEERPGSMFKVCESAAVSYKDIFGNIWKRDLLRVLCEYNYCRMLLLQATTHMVIVGTRENATAVKALFNYLRAAFKHFAEERHARHVQGMRGYYRTKKFKKAYIRSYLEGCTPGLRWQLEKMDRSLQETALVACHKQLIKEYMDTVSLVKRKPVRSKHRTNLDAYYAGVNDGKNINLNRQLADNTNF